MMQMDEIEEETDETKGSSPRVKELSGRQSKVVEEGVAAPAATPATADGTDEALDVQPPKKGFVRTHIPEIILTIILIIGVGIFCYPIVSDYWNSFTQSRAIASYSDAVESMNQEELDQMYAEAEVWNAEIAESGGGTSSLPGSKLDEYNSLLNVSQTGMMGYIEIAKIDLHLPIYHGTSDAVLSAGVGHLEGSSLPVGGTSSHCVLMAHRGLPTSLLFTNLDRVEVGDSFSITILNHTLYYEVDQVVIRAPDDLGELDLVPGQDYVTLVTCTPYGINSHRLLVRGHRVSAPTQAPQTSDARVVDGVIVAGFLLLVLIVAGAIGMMIWTRLRRPRM